MKVVLLLMVMVSIIVAGCSLQSPTVQNVSTGKSGFVEFGSVQELESFLQAHKGQDVYRGGVMMDVVTSAAAPMLMSESKVSGASDYSQTNTQYVGVDEGDIVKNDDSYVYMISGDRVVIIDARNPTDAGIISEIGIKSSGYYGPYARALFIEGDTLIVIVQDNDKGYTFRKYDITPMQNYNPVTKVLVYDVSDRKNPVLSEEFSISGNAGESRMIKGMLYLTTEEYAQTDIVRPPIIMARNEKIMPPIYYPTDESSNYNYHTIVSIDVKDKVLVDSQTLLLGYGTTLMMSEENIYVAYQKSSMNCFWRGCSESYDKDRFYKVIVPLLEGEFKDDIVPLVEADMDEDLRWEKISDRMSKLYQKVNADESLQEEYESMFENIQLALDDYDSAKRLADEKTIIYRFSISDGRIREGASGSVDGRLLNQFSMDEYGGNLRVATTVSMWLSSGLRAYNNMYVLNEDLEVIGKATNIAPNESIYATRFMGDKLFMVTFRQIDPFFVIDLSNPTAPTILGALKIPGYSSYLHPISDTLILGVGKETSENEWGGVQTDGIKLSLFDVSDFEHPKEVSKVEIGDQGSDSAVLYDHKAFLYSKSKNMIVLPVTAVETREKMGMYEYRYKTWNGAYVYRIDSNNKFDLVGKIKHSSATSTYFNWWDQSTVSRSLYFDDALYTVSTKYVKVNDLGDDLKELTSIDLPQAEEYRGPILY